jgi:acetyl esterase/lipase
MDALFRTFKLKADNIEDMRSVMSRLPNVYPPRTDVFTEEVYFPNHDYQVRSTWTHRGSGKFEKVILYFHGGGQCAGKPEHEFHVSDELAYVTGAAVLSVDYRLLPEYTLPTILSDSVAAYNWLLKNFTADQIILTGCSGGGMHTLLLTLRLAIEGFDLPAGALVLSPGLGCEVLLDDGKLPYDLPSWQAELVNDTDAMLDIGNISNGTVAAMLEIMNSNKEYILSLFDRAKGLQLPPLHFQVGNDEFLADSGRLCYERLKRDGVKVTIENTPYLSHCYWFVKDIVPEAEMLFHRFVMWMEKAWEHR